MQGWCQYPGYRTLQDSRISEQYTGNNRCLNGGLPRHVWTAENCKNLSQHSQCPRRGCEPTIRPQCSTNMMWQTVKEVCLPRPFHVWPIQNTTHLNI